MTKFRVGVVGAGGHGGIGRQHLAEIAANADCALAGVADPAPAAREIADQYGAKLYPTLAELLAGERPDGVIIAAPNQLHLSLALDCIAAGVPALVEKPITVTVAEGRELAEASEAAGVPVLVGHHRRHNPLIARAKEIVAGGGLGRLVSATVIYTHFKPAEYFNLAWRRQPGGGPILINLIHEIDLIRYICGDIATVQAIASNAVRGFEVEDTAGVLLRLVNGAVVAITLSDTAAAPWSWDLSSGESKLFPPQPPVQTHFLSGDEGSLTLPTLDHWRYPGVRSWHTPISRHAVDVTRGNPYAEQLKHFIAVARGQAQPLVSARDGMRTLEATLAVKEAAQTGATVRLVD